SLNADAHQSTTTPPPSVSSTMHALSLPAALPISSACTRIVGFHLLDGAGHWVQQEQPGPVSATLIGFLRDYAKNPISVALTGPRSEEHTSELQSPYEVVVSLLLETNTPLACSTR